MPARDQHFMRLALNLAARARGQTHPNPMVGAVIVCDGKIVGKGFHRRVGQSHAEIFALRHAGARAQGATLYVSLEPCCHIGRTPPCTEAIQSAGIRRVVTAMIDPDPRNRGRGIKWLKQRGIQTKVGILKKEAAQLNKVFVTWKTKNRPFVMVKVAQSLDGKIATRSGNSKWISGRKASAWVHQLRSRVDAILVGIGTVLKDNPRLTCRDLLTLRQAQRERTALPIRVILDSNLRTPLSSRIFSSKLPVIIAATNKAPKEREKKLRQKRAEVLRLPGMGGRVSIPALLRELARREISHLLVEGGGEVIASVFAARAVDQIAVIIAPRVIGGRNAKTAVEGIGIDSLSKSVKLKKFDLQRLGSDLLVTADVS